MTFTTLALALLLGAAFGAILQRVQASAPDRILATLRLQDLTILKFMLLAIGVGAVGIGALTALGLAHLSIKPLALVAVAAGGLIFGVGFAVGGYCPGTCLAGAAEGRRDALFIIAGGLVGAAAYTFAHPWLARHLVAPLDLGGVTLATLSGLAPGLLGLGFGAAMVLLAFLLPTHPGSGARAAQPAAQH